MNVLNRIIFAFAECRQIDQALLIFHQIKSLKCKPDLITYNIVLDILGSSGCVDKMLHEFSSMKEAEISPDIISYNKQPEEDRKSRHVCSIFQGNGWSRHVCSIFQGNG